VFVADTDIFHYRRVYLDSISTKFATEIQLYKEQLRFSATNNFDNSLIAAEHNVNNKIAELLGSQVQVDRADDARMFLKQKVFLIVRKNVLDSALD
jgi:hypothetical protein